MLLGDGKEDFDNLRIELRAGAALDFFAGMRHLESPAVGTVTHHGVERVRDSD